MLPATAVDVEANPMLPTGAESGSIKDIRRGGVPYVK